MSWSKWQRAYVKDWLWAQSQRCFYCFVRLEYDKATMDHLIPVARGGRNYRENMVLCCAKCNQAKDDQDWGWKDLSKIQRCQMAPPPPPPEVIERKQKPPRGNRWRRGWRHN